MSYFLFLDDIRVPKDVKWVDIPAANWVIVRSYGDFVAKILKDGLPEFISFDHDLGDKAMKHCIENNGKSFDYDRVEEMTGMHCAKWLVNYCLDNNREVPDFSVHTVNPCGRDNINGLLNQAKKVINVIDTTQYIAQTEEDATKLANENGFKVRVLLRDGEQLVGTADYDTQRLTFGIEKGIVISVVVG